MNPLLVLFPAVSLSWPWGWETVAVSVGCQKEFSIEAKEGENIVHLVENGEKISLHAEGNYVFMARPPVTMIFYNTVPEDTSDFDLRYRFVYPAHGSSSPLLLEIISEERKDICRLRGVGPS